MASFEGSDSRSSYSAVAIERRLAMSTIAILVFAAFVLSRERPLRFFVFLIDDFIAAPRRKLFSTQRRSHGECFVAACRDPR